MKIGRTSRGSRVWLQGLSSHAQIHYSRYSVEYVGSTMRIVFGPHGKRQMTMAKGGIVDIVGKRVSTWAGKAIEAHVEFADNVIFVTPKED
jgi:hypothetical protein